MRNWESTLGRNMSFGMSIRVLTVVLAFYTLAAPQAAEAKGCWCKIRTSCDGWIAEDLGKVDEYKWYESKKKKKCATACSTAASKYQGNAALGAKICAELDTGSHTVKAYSVVGDKDNKNNTCDVDQTLGPISCRQDCSCPKADCSCPEGTRLSGELCLGSCLPADTAGIKIVDGKVAFPASCEITYEVEAGKCVGPCISCSTGVCGIPPGVSGASVSGQQLSFDASCETVVSW